MRLLVVLATTLVAMPILRAADFWTSSDPAQWSAQDIKKMVTDSPWAKQANVHLKGDTLAAVAAGTDRTMESAPATPQILVRWDSAFPVCEACEKVGLER